MSNSSDLSTLDLILTCCLLALLLFGVAKGVADGNGRKSTDKGGSNAANIMVKDAVMKQKKNTPASESVEALKSRLNRNLIPSPSKSIQDFSLEGPKRKFSSNSDRFQKNKTTGAYGRTDTKVSFSAEVNICPNATLSMLEATEWYTVFYTREDLERIQHENDRILDGEIKECAEGLDQATSAIAVQRVVSAVLNEQERQKASGTDDDEKIANASLKVSKRSSKSASSRGSSTESEARSFSLEELREEKELKFNKATNRKQRRSTFGVVKKKLSTRRYKKGNSRKIDI